MSVRPCGGRGCCWLVIGLLGCGGDSGDSGNAVKPDPVSAAAGVASYDLSLDMTTQRWLLVVSGETKTLASINFDSGLSNITATSTFEDNGTRLIHAAMTSNLATNPDGSETNTATLEMDFSTVTVTGVVGPNGDDARVTYQSTMGDPTPLVVYQSVSGIESVIDDNALAAWKAQAGFFMVESSIAVFWTNVALSDVNVMEVVEPIARRATVGGSSAPGARSLAALSVRPAHLSDFCRAIINGIVLSSAISCSSCTAALAGVALSGLTLTPVAAVGCSACFARLGFSAIKGAFCANQSAKATSLSRCAQSTVCPFFAIPIPTPDEHGCSCQCDPTACETYCVRTNDSNFTGVCTKGGSSEFFDVCKCEKQP